MKVDFMQIESFDVKLRELLDWLEKETGFEFTNTSPYRIGNKGVHGTMPLRGWDLRCRNLAVGRAISKLINSVWKYDTKRPRKKCCYLHGKGSKLHLHLQVHPNTIKL